MASPLVDAQDFDDLGYMAGMCQKRTFGIPRRAQGRMPKGSDASSRQPAVLPTYGIGGMYGLTSAPHLIEASTNRPRTLFRLTIPIRAVNQLFKKCLVTAGA
jgi:hypothetical protein